MSEMPERFELEFPPGALVQIARAGAFRGGPLDGASFFFQVPIERDLTDLRVSLPRPDGQRDLYLYDQQPNSTSLEAGMRYIGTVVGSA